jgi:hypothetical protein
VGGFGFPADAISSNGTLYFVAGGAGNVTAQVGAGVLGWRAGRFFLDSRVAFRFKDS